MNKIDLTTIVGLKIIVEFSGRDASWGLSLLNSSNIKSKHIRIYPDSWISNADRNVIIPDGLKCIAMYVSFEGERYVLHGETKRGQFFVDGKSEARNQLVCSEHIKVIGPAEGWSYA